VFIRDMFPYMYVDTRQKPKSLEDVFLPLFEFLTLKELVLLTGVSKWFYSEIIVLCRIMFVAKANAANKTILNVGDNDDDDDDDNQEERRTLVIQGKKRIIGERDEIEVYSLYFANIDAITSISLPRGYKDKPPVIVYTD
jgi:hypothetical protein